MRKPTQPNRGNGSALSTSMASTMCFVATLAARFKRSIASSLQSAKRQTAAEVTLGQKFVAALACRQAEDAAISG